MDDIAWPPIDRDNLIIGLDRYRRLIESGATTRVDESIPSAPSPFRCPPRAYLFTFTPDEGPRMLAVFPRPDEVDLLEAWRLLPEGTQLPAELWVLDDDRVTQYIEVFGG